MSTVSVAQINVIVADLERSRAFYELLGLSFARRSRTGQGPAEAWVCVCDEVTLVLHSPSFAAWRDDSAPAPQPGGPQVDYAFDSAEELRRVVAALELAGASVIKPPTATPWGQLFAIVTDPDGHRPGLKAPVSGS